MGGGRGCSPTFWVGVCCTVLKTLTLFQSKMYDFAYLFSDLTPNIYTTFQTFQTKKAKTIPYFRLKRLENHTPKCGTYLYSSYIGVPRPPPGGFGLPPHLFHVQNETNTNKSCIDLFLWFFVCSFSQSCSSSRSLCFDL